VLDEFPDGRVFRETDEAEATRETVIEDIVTGQYKKPVRVIAFNTAEGWARDVTEEIAREICASSVVTSRSDRANSRFPRNWCTVPPQGECWALTARGDRGVRRPQRGSQVNLTLSWKRSRPDRAAFSFWQHCWQQSATFIEWAGAAVIMLASPDLHPPPIIPARKGPELQISLKPPGAYIKCNFEAHNRKL
jgi:hypothetical protein